MIERLSPLESIMWRVGQDPTLRMNIGVLIVLDRAVEVGDLVDRLVTATTRASRLHRRPDDQVHSRLRPMWLEEDDDAATAAELHVRSIDVAAPGSMRQVLDLVALLEPVPFDPERSPWDVTLIHGLEDEGSALYVRAHHVLTDGLGGVRLLDELLDRTGDAPAEETSKPRRRRARDADDERPAREWGTVTIDLSNVLGTVATGVNRARDAQPVESVVRGVQRMLDLASSVSRQVLVAGGPLAPVPATHSVVSHFDALSAPHARATALTLGGGRTDVLVTAAAAALGLYHERSGVTCPEVRVAIPARRPRDDDTGGNWFAPTRVEIPTALDHPGRQLGVVTERLSQARHEPALQVAGALTSAVGLLPDRLLLPAVQMQVDQIDLAVTAVPGLRADAHICGAKVQVAYPLGPRLGSPINITAFGSNGGLDVGIVVDPASITDPDAFRECLDEAFTKLATARA